MSRRKEDRIKLDRMTVKAEDVRSGDWLVVANGFALMLVDGWDLRMVGTDPAEVTIHFINGSRRYVEGDKVNIWREVKK